MMEDKVAEEDFSFFKIKFLFIELCQQYIEFLIVTIDHEPLYNMRACSCIVLNSEFSLDRLEGIFEREFFSGSEFFLRTIERYISATRLSIDLLLFEGVFTEDFTSLFLVKEIKLTDRA